MKPPNEASTDSIINVYSHEIWEALTNTYGAYYRSCDGYENADLCNYNFGIVSVSGSTFSGNKVNYNMILNNTKYLVQHNWLRANPYYSGTEKCAISADATSLNHQGASGPSILLSLLALIVLPLCCCCICFYYRKRICQSNNRDKSNKIVAEEETKEGDASQPAVDAVTTTKPQGSSGGGNISNKQNKISISITLEPTDDDDAAEGTETASAPKITF